MSESSQRDTPGDGIGQDAEKMASLGSTRPAAKRIAPASVASAAGRKPALHYLDLSGDSRIRTEWPDLLRGFALTAHGPESSIVEMQFAESTNLACAVAEVPKEGYSLSPWVRVRTILHPPLILVSETQPPADECELLRSQGALAIIGSNPSEAERQFLTQSVFRPAPQFQGNIEEFDLVSILHSMARKKKSGMVLAGCPHVRALSPEPWRQNEAETCLGDGDCPGWSGRIYLAEGDPIFAETPNAAGREALIRLLRIRTGYVRVHPFLLAPRTKNLRNSLEYYFLAESKTDEDPELFGLFPTETGASTPLTEGSFESPTSPPEQAEPPAKGPKRIALPDGARAGSTDSQGGDVDMINVDETDKVILDELLRGSDGLQTAARADDEGTILALAGEGGGEELAAISYMCGRALTRAAESLGLGSVTGYAVVGSQRSLYVHSLDQGYFAAAGESVKNPASTLDRVAQTVGKREGSDHE